MNRTEYEEALITSSHRSWLLGATEHVIQSCWATTLYAEDSGSRVGTDRIDSDDKGLNVGGLGAGTWDCFPGMAFFLVGSSVTRT